MLNFNSSIFDKHTIIGYQHQFPLLRSETDSIYSAFYWFIITHCGCQLNVINADQVARARDWKSITFYTRTGTIFFSSFFILFFFSENCHRWNVQLISSVSIIDLLAAHYVCWNDQRSHRFKFNPIHECFFCVRFFLLFVVMVQSFVDIFCA